MKKSKILLPISIAALGLAAILISMPVKAQVGSNRKELQRHDLSIPGREVIQAIVTVGQGETAPRHKHPGEEIIYVLEGSFEYYMEGKPSVKLKAGDVLYIPYGTIHSAKNIGTGKASELATYIVEKGKPLLELIK